MRPFRTCPGVATLSAMRIAHALIWFGVLAKGLKFKEHVHTKKLTDYDAIPEAQKIRTRVAISHEGSHFPATQFHEPPVELDAGTYHGHKITDASIISL